MEKLELCPFCASPTEVIMAQHDGGLEREYVCKNDRCFMHTIGVPEYAAHIRPIEDGLQSKIDNVLRMIDGAKSSPDYPANLPALLEEIREELERVDNGG